MPQNAAPLVGSAPRPESTQPSEAPTAALKLEWPSDLVQVETDPQKRQEAAAYVQPESAPRPPRPRPAPLPVDDEPLIQVETRRSAALADVARTATGERDAASAAGHV